MIRLFTFHQSGSAYRVRIALALKDLEYEPIYVAGGRGSTDLMKPDYLALNPSGLIPTLIDGDLALHQSMAILEYLDDAYPERPLLPADPGGRARVRAMAQVIFADTHPLTASRVVDYLDGNLRLEKDRQTAWLKFWNARGLSVLERMLDDGGTATYCHGDSPTMADIALVSQVFVAQNVGVDLAPLPRVRAIYETCRALPAFIAAAPENQGDAPGN